MKQKMLRVCSKLSRKKKKEEKKLTKGMTLSEYTCYYVHKNRERWIRNYCSVSSLYSILERKGLISNGN